MAGVQQFTVRSGQPEAQVAFGAGGGTVTVVGGTVYYRDEPGVTASVNDGSIVDGGSVTLLGTQFFSTAASRVDGQVRLADVAVSASTAATKPGPFLGLPIVALHASHQANGSLVATTSGNSRVQHLLCEDVVEVRFVYTNWCAGELSGSGDMTITAGMEMPLATIVPVTFDGALSTVLSPDGVRISDPVPVDAVLGTAVYSRTHWATPTSWPFVRTVFAANSEGGENGAGLADKSLSGTISAVTAAVYCPSAVVGVLRSGRTRTWVSVHGDSIASGQGDDANDKGYVARALEAAQIPFLNLARGGESGQTYAALATSRRRRQLAASADYVYDEYGTNDVYAARTLVQVQADKLAIWTAHANRGARVFTQTLSPRVTTTDGCTTVANQTASPGNTVRVNYNNWLRDGAPIDATTKAAVAVGTSSNVLRAGQTGHPLSVSAAYAPLGYVEMADVMESARDSGKWKVPGISGTGDTTSASPTVTNVVGVFVNGQAIVGTGIPAAAYVVSGGGTATLTISANATATATGVALAAAWTVDGTHPSPALHALMAAALPPALFA